MKRNLTQLEITAIHLIHEGFDDKDIMVRLLTYYDGTPYVYGGSSPDTGSDCSGVASGCLNALFGTKRRLTADQLYHRYFTKIPGDYKGQNKDDEIVAAFFVDDKDHAVHISCHMAEGFYLNESSIEKNACATVRKEKELEKMYSDYKMVIRALDKKAWAQN